MAWLQALDTSLFRFINQSLSNPLCDVLMPWLSGSRWFIPLAVLLAAALVWRGRRKAVCFLLLLTLALGVSDGLVCNTLKHALARPRPCAALDNVHVLINCTDSGSMPSSHAANTFAAAMVALMFYRRSWRVMVPLAVAVSLSRVFNGVHYPGDILVGAILGAGTGLAVVFGLNGAWQLIGRRWFPLWHARLPSLIPASNAPPAGSPNLEPGTWNAELNAHWLRAGCVVIAVLTVVKWFYLASGTIELSEDEAYQWVWSKHLAWSYYSKPPLIALAQWLGTHLWGDTAFGIRFLSPLIGATLGVVLLRFFAREVNARAGFFLVLILQTTPLLAVGTTLLTVDPLTVLFWSAALLSGWRAVQPDSPHSAWLWTGLWMGLGFLSKYSSPLLWMCWAVFFILWPPARQHLRRPGPYLALGVNLLCTLPVIIWNWQHGWITLKHVARHGGVGKAAQPLAKHISWVFELLGAEFGLLNPVYFVAALVAVVAVLRYRRRDARLIYFLCMGTPVFLLYVLLALKSRVQPNWVAPAVIPMFCVMVLYWEDRWRSGVRQVKPWLAAGLGLGLVAVVVIHDTNLIGRITGRPLPAKLDPLTRVRGHEELGRVVDKVRKELEREGRPVFVIGAHYGITSLLNFYLPGARAQVRETPMAFAVTTKLPRSQYYFWPGYAETRRGQNALFVRESNSADAKASEPLPTPLAAQFDSVTRLGRFEVRYRGRVLREIEIFACRNLR
jgi:membrane-associated phospholipid phosphatase